MIERARIEEQAASVRLRLEEGQKTTYTFSTASANELLTDYLALLAIVEALARRDTVYRTLFGYRCEWCDRTGDSPEAIDHHADCAPNMARELLAATDATEATR